MYEGAGAEDFAGYAIEEIEEDGAAKSVAAVIISGSSPTIENVVAGLELSVAGLLSDEEERAKKAEEDAAEEAYALYHYICWIRYNKESYSLRWAKSKWDPPKAAQRRDAARHGRVDEEIHNE